MDIIQKIKKELDVIEDTKRMLKQIDDVKKMMEMIEKYSPKKVSKTYTSPTYEPA